MKILNVALPFTAAVCALSAQAQDSFRFQPYVGGEYQHVFLKFKHNLSDVYQDDFNGAAVYLGARLHDNFGVELGYSRTGEESKSSRDNNGEINTKIKLQSVTVEALGYYPLDMENKLDLIASLGVAHTQMRIKREEKFANLQGSASASETKTNLRLGLGAQYEAFDNFRIRGMLHWENSGSEIADHAYSLSLGVNYSF